MPPVASLTSSHRSAGRSKTATMSTSTPADLTLSTRNLRPTSGLSQRNGDRSAGACSPSPVSPVAASFRSGSRSNLAHDMVRSTSTSTKTSSNKLHKRGTASTPSLPASSPPFANGARSQFTTPFATYEEPFPDVDPLPAPNSSVPKIKPYLRKMSTTKEDQGTIDLSKSMNENDRVAGLGIQDFGTKSAADVSFAHSRRGRHGRSISGESQGSAGSGSFKPGQPFTHPMAKTPRPYTPPAGRSYASSLNDEEANESDDIVEDEFRWAAGYSKRRSMSISSNNPTPLSQTLNASELGLIPKLTNASQSNLSTVSYHSDKSSGPKKGRSRRNTELSQDHVSSPTSRTSLDKAFSLVGRRSEAAEPQSRNEMIAVARKKFEEKEANKDLKYESKRRQSESKEHERQRKKSETPTAKSALTHAQPDRVAEKEKRRRKSSAAAALAGAERDERAQPKSKKSKQQPSRDEFRAMSYDDYRPANAASLPRYGTDPGCGQSALSEKTPRAEYELQPMIPEKKDDGSWMRFSTWVQTRMLSCGGRD
ncbi:Hypothetical predicted protein [Lecanosticta acicola]|uniref:Uncharacterized protein n=1 Tax=Lecanosticta acicola TaxID=111012 RepID=A0AAI9EC17_9PEZI|nr:Hypothetical predicted protein [Lecanosticta acicola]